MEQGWAVSSGEGSPHQGKPQGHESSSLRACKMLVVKMKVDKGRDDFGSQAEPIDCDGLMYAVGSCL
jgi:hypothetical protein